VGQNPVRRGEPVDLHIDGVYRPERSLNGYWVAAAYSKVVTKGRGHISRFASDEEFRFEKQAQDECDFLNGVGTERAA
jgi:hypothetical protein